MIAEDRNDSFARTESVPCFSYFMYCILKFSNEYPGHELGDISVEILFQLIKILFIYCYCI